MKGARGLGNLGAIPPEAVNVLKAALDDEDSVVRRQACDALEKIDTQPL